MHGFCTLFLFLHKYETRRLIMIMKPINTYSYDGSFHILCERKYGI